MPLKPQDIVIALKLVAIADKEWTQTILSNQLCMSLSEVNGGLKRLLKSHLLLPAYEGEKAKLNKSALTEFLIHGLKYVYPAELGELTRGVPTGYASPIFKGIIFEGSEPIPVWPYSEGEHRGYALLPLYKSVPKSVIKFPDKEFYSLLSLVDALRHGRARERKIAQEFLIEALKKRKQDNNKI